jgi:nucleotide-binding universal stress UspA family protein
MFRSIVVGTDGSATAREAVTQAVALARAFDATLHVVCAYEPPAVQMLRGEPRGTEATLDDWALNARADAEATLAEAQELAAGGGVPVQRYARQGDAADAILDVAEERSADLVIVGNKGFTGAKRFLLGSVPNKVSHHAPCSVLIIRTS